MDKSNIFDNMFMETADVANSLPPMEMFRGAQGLGEYAKANKLSEATGAAMYSTMLSAPRWLPHAAEVYHMSKNASDYFLVPTIIMPTDLPNRNLTAFPREELSKFDPQIGDHVYAGWKGKPIYVEHDNRDYHKSMGAVVDVAMRKIANSEGDLWKVIALMAIDRTKNPKIANDIQAGRRRNYSMGAMVSAYQCSICSATGFIRAGIKNKYEAMPCGTEHASYDRSGQFRTLPHKLGSNIRTIGYLNARGVKPFEISSVGYPAFASAYTPEDQHAAL